MGERLYYSIRERLLRRVFVYNVISPVGDIGRFGLAILLKNMLLAVANPPKFNATPVQNITPITKPVASSGGKASEKQKGLISKLAKEKVDGDCVPVMQQMFSKASVSNLTSKEASGLIKYLMELR